MIEQTESSAINSDDISRENINSDPVKNDQHKETHVFNVDDQLAKGNLPANAEQRIVVGGSDLQPVTEKAARKPRRFTYPSGSTILDGYTIKRGIGIGGFGEVYFALSDAGKEVALKRIQRNLDVEIRGVRQCLNLKHINLIALWDIRQDSEGESWVVMEYVPGDSLRDLLEQQPKGINLKDAQRWFSEILSGVGYLHDRGIVHRDLKPGNIFYDQDEKVVKIGDYGLSKFISTSKRDGQTESVGTFHYMAPEIGKGSYGKEIDIYSLGIILCEVLTGMVPFDGESGQEIIMKHLTADPELHFVPERFRPVIKRALAKNPTQRFENVFEMEKMIQWTESTIVVQSRTIFDSDTSDESSVDVRPTNRPSSNQPARESFLITDEEPMYIADEPENDRGTDDAEIQLGELTDRSHYSGTKSSEHSRYNASSHEATARSNPIRSESVNNPVVRDRGIDEGISVISANLNASATASKQGVRPKTDSANQKFTDWWNGLGGTPVKAILVAVLAIVILVNSQWLIPTAILFGLIYLGIHIVQSFRLGGDSNSTSGGTVIRPFSQKECDRLVDARLRETRLNVPFSEKTAEALGSILMATVIVAVATLVAVGFSGFSWDNTAETLSLFAWLTATAAIGCGAVITYGKSIEARDGNQWIRRFALMTLGLCFGFLFYSLYHGFFISNIAMPAEIVELQQSVWSLESTPELMRFLTFFGVWFAVIRWWKVGDPLRKTQFSVMLLCLHATLSIVLAIATSFPVLWALIIGASMSMGVQMSTTWINTREREALTFEVMQTTAKS